MRALVLGGSGLLGRALVSELRDRGVDCAAPGREEVELKDPATPILLLDRFEPEVVFNCAAFTRVDECEARPEHAMEVNGAAVARLVEACRGRACRVVQVSTDYVFDGRACSPYREDAPTSPISVYGRSKLVGELAALAESSSLVVRTSWLFGVGGASFVRTVVGLLERAAPLRIVDDQVGCPTYAPYLARALCDLASSEARGVYHYCNRGPVSWHGLAREIAARLAPDHEIVAVSSEEFPRPAPRPAYSVLGVEKFEAAVGRRVECWLTGLERCLSELPHAERGDR
jgi:dTDP-4-dehydrorhamnose reductase